MSERRLGAAETREYQIALLEAFLHTSASWMDRDGEVAQECLSWAKTWWLGAFEAVKIGPCSPSWLTPSFMSEFVASPKMRSRCRAKLIELTSQRIGSGQ